MTAPKTGLKRVSLDLRQIYGRCIEEGECLLWSQATNSTGSPYAQHDGETVNLRRLTWTLIHNQPIRKNYRVSPNCGNSLCLAADHLRAKSPAEVAAASVAAGRYVSPLADARKRAARQAQSRWTMDDARAIRADKRTLDEISAQYGMSRQHAHQIRTGKSWKEPHGAFAGLIPA